MTRRRWWETEGHSVENEAAWFLEAGLEFALDEDLLRDAAVVVFHGELRLGDRRVPADVVYPPSYGTGGHPEVVAPTLPVTRHRSPDGHLCLDHSVLGESQPMDGAEAVIRAERLWDLWENDRQQLEAEEADAPDPAANYYDFHADSAITISDIELGTGTQGYFRLEATCFEPMRAVVAEVRVTHPQPVTLHPSASIEALKGPFELSGGWKRVDSPPPFSVSEFGPWLEEHHRSFRDRQLEYGKQQATAEKRPDLPTVLAFVYPDEGPGRGQTHDAWLFCVVETGTTGAYFARSCPLQTEERWLRQPQLQGLEDKQVIIVGAGALGSQVADLLAKAGVGRFMLIDFDIFSHGNRVRHQLDLRDIGRAKVRAMRNRLVAVNPWCEVEIRAYRVGAAGGQGLAQRLDDRLFDQVGSSDLLINASANSATGRHLSSLAVNAETTAIHTWVSAGAWGCRVLVQRPRVSACWECLGLAQKQSERYPEPMTVPPVPSDPAVREVNEQGCADPTFTGPGFELAEAAAATARIAVQTLLDDGASYPTADFDLATLRFRDGETATTTASYISLPVHPDCAICNASP